jgi:hypothetical protein
MARDTVAEVVTAAGQLIEDVEYLLEIPMELVDEYNRVRRRAAARADQLKELLYDYESAVRAKGGC